VLRDGAGPPVLTQRCPKPVEIPQHNNLLPRLMCYRYSGSVCLGGAYFDGKEAPCSIELGRELEMPRVTRRSLLGSATSLVGCCACGPEVIQNTVAVAQTVPGSAHLSRRDRLSDGGHLS
jgi:hypothetical protein